MLSRDGQLNLWISESTREAVDAVLRRAQALGLGCFVQVNQDRLTKVTFYPTIRKADAAEGGVKQPPE